MPPEHCRRLILQQSFTPSIQDLMNQLHWLPIKARIDFKLEIRSMERGICPIAVLFCIKTRSFFNI